MNEKIRSYSKCDFQIVSPSISISTDSLQGEIVQGQVVTQEFVISSTNGVEITGNVEVFDHRIKLIKGDFATTSFTVRFEVNAYGLYAGDVISGMFHVLTNGGEFDVPYSYQVIGTTMQTKGGEIHNFKEFADLAQMNQAEAVRVFSDEMFLPILCQGQGKESYARIYRSLNKCRDKAQALEEFLVTIKEKDAVTLSGARATSVIRYDKEDVAKDITIRKSTWGYVKYQVKCDYDCIFIPKKMITADDFTGKEMKLPVVVAIDKLPSSECTIPILIYNTTSQLQILLKISPKGTKKEKTPLEIMFSTEHLRKTYQKQLIQDYLAYRSGKKTLQEYAKQSLECLNELIKTEERHHYYRLIRLHMYIMKKDRMRADQEFDTIEQHSDKMILDNLSNCYYMYLKALYYRQEQQIEQCLSILYDALEREPDQFLYFFMILYLDVSLQENRNQIYEYLKSIYESGNNSALLYFEACELFNEFPNMIRELDSFCVKIIGWGFRHNYLNFAVRDQFIALAKEQHSYDDKVYHILDHLYQQVPEPKVLQVICESLIQGRKTGKEYHIYYELGVKHSLKLLGLMEYYMKSMDVTTFPILPKQVIMYFGYEKDRLNVEGKTYLYANMIHNKESYGEAYEEYVPRIKQFAIAQIRLQKLNDTLLMIYRECLMDSEVVAAVAKELSGIMFKQKLYVENAGITAVLVDFDECSKTLRYPVVNHMAYVDILTDHASITLLDRDDKRYVGSVPYTLESVFEDQEFLPHCYDANETAFSVLLRIACYADRTNETDYETIKVYRSLLEYEDISSDYRKRLNGIILQYYYEQYEGDIFEDYLSKVNLELLDSDNRELAVSYMIDRELYDMAKQAISIYGYDGIERDRIKQLCTYLVEQENVEYDDLLVTMAFELFHADDYGETVLKYLIRFAKGGNEELLAIYKAARQLSFHTYDLEERIVTQALVSDCYKSGVFDAFVAYTKKNPKSYIYEAFLNVMAYRYFMEERKDTLNLCEYWAQAYEKEQLTYPMCQAAMLYGFSQDSDAAKQWTNVIYKVMQQFIKNDMLFPFMSAFRGIVELPEEIFVKSFAIYKTKPHHQVNVHYYRKGPKRPDSHMERMREYFDGYYVKDFVLFDDEELVYYVTDEWEGELTRVEAKDIPLYRYQTEDEEQVKSRFAMINELIRGQSELEQDNFEEYEEKMRLYIKDMYLIDTNMTLL